MKDFALMCLAFSILAGGILFCVKYVIEEPLGTGENDLTIIDKGKTAGDIIFEPHPLSDETKLVLSSNGDFIYRGKKIANDLEVYRTWKAWFYGACHCPCQYESEIFEEKK